MNCSLWLPVSKVGSYNSEKGLKNKSMVCQFIYMSIYMNFIEQKGDLHFAVPLNGWPQNILKLIKDCKSSLLSESIFLSIMIANLFCDNSRGVGYS